MRTKALLLAAAFVAAGAATSMAQVYSANAVGYVNLSLQPGFNMIANPLNGTNNNLNTTLPLPVAEADSLIWRFDRDGSITGTPQSYIAIGAYDISEANVFWAALDDDGVPRPDNWVTIDPGEGFWFVTKPGRTTALNVTFVGEVPQGVQNVDVGGNSFSLLASAIPQALALGGDVPASGNPTLEFAPQLEDTLWIFSATTQRYGDPIVYVDANGDGSLLTWAVFPAVGDPYALPDGPVIPVATAFFVARSGAATTWTRDFSVNNP